MAIRLFAAHFWIPSRRLQGLPVAGDPKFQRRRRILILTGFSSPYLSTFLNGNANNGGSRLRTLDEMPCSPGTGFKCKENKIRSSLKPCIKRHPSVPVLSHCMNLALPYAHFCYFRLLSPLAEYLIMSMFPYL
ncbi:hypothetical protein EV363DRAFT_1160450 [Boletus edulis]|uniref:Uncharacterized protein n=1 Tax=Boletus edulis BED1 TaxID=1328754 RepID=A0AAD4C1S1_BOLED|nr:hypothetical protein EV363DRAFT_1160450 [Boletus edulis]KAF8444981.1 hypothetical protein L210DRAFT_943711 [Boletus edulis BED1]